MAAADTVLVIRPDGTASLVGWPAADDGRRAVITAEVGHPTTMRRCGKGILGFATDDSVAAADSVAAGDESAPQDRAVNRFAAAAYAEQGIELASAPRGPVLFARNPSKGSVVKPLTPAQTANLLVVTGAHLV